MPRAGAGMRTCVSHKGRPGHPDCAPGPGIRSCKQSRQSEFERGGGDPHRPAPWTRHWSAEPPAHGHRGRRGPRATAPHGGVGGVASADVSTGWAAFPPCRRPEARASPGGEPSSLLVVAPVTVTLTAQSCGLCQALCGPCPPPLGLSFRQRDFPGAWVPGHVTPAPTMLVTVTSQRPGFTLPSETADPAPASLALWTEPPPAG